LRNYHLILLVCFAFLSFSPGSIHSARFEFGLPRRRSPRFRGR
jgi:hypothetical protein